MKQIILSIITITFISLFASCKKEEEPTPQENPELITSIELRFTNDANSADIRTFAFRDPDGPGGNAPSQFDTIRLDNNTNWELTVTILDESVTPAENITVEVEEEGDEHQFFFTVSPGLNMTIAYSDTDVNGDPVGIINTASIGDNSTGIFTIILKHQPGTKDGNIATGDTDLEVAFITEIE